MCEQLIKGYACLGVSKVVFVAFTQHCIQSTVTHVRGVEDYCTLYTVASRPCQEGRLFEPSVLGV